MKINDHFILKAEVGLAKQRGQALVALESAVITHGLPYPTNLSLARDLERTVRDLGAIPATIGVLDGKILVGLDENQLERLANFPTPPEGSAKLNLIKVSSRDFAPAILYKQSGGTTVAGTLLAAHAAGIQVFATGGIGGVHRDAPADVSADLPQLSKTPLIVVCAGAKSILDLPATLEYLETAGVPVIGYQTEDFPAFYTARSGLKVQLRANSVEDIVSLARIHWGLGQSAAILVTVPPPSGSALPEVQVESAIAEALVDAERQGVRGQGVTPFLLARVSELTGGASLKANLSLLQNNAHIAAQIALELTKSQVRWV